MKPILILISVLIFEIKSKNLKIFLLILILIPTIINNFIEIKFRKNTKPEFVKLLNILKNQEVKNLTLIGRNRELQLVENYVSSLYEYKNNNFEILNIKNLPTHINKIWVICYEPLLGFNCTLPEDKKIQWDLLSVQKTHLLSSQLFKVKRKVQLNNL